MRRRVKILALRIKAEKAWRQYQKALDSVDCGSGLAEHILPELARTRAELVKAMDELEQLGYRPEVN